MTLAGQGDILCSDPVPTIGRGRITLRPGPLPVTGEAQIRWLVRPADTLPADAVLLRIKTSGTLAVLDVHVTSSGTWYVSAYSSHDTGGSLESARGPRPARGSAATTGCRSSCAAGAVVDVGMVAVPAGKGATAWP